MKLICIGTLDKFSRFYDDIAHHLNDNNSVKVYSIHISGYLYLALRFKSSCLISFKAWYRALKRKNEYLKVINAQDNYKEINFNTCIEFHTHLDSKISLTLLKLQALAYIDLFNQIFDRENPSHLLTIGDSRLSIEVAIAIANQRGIKIYYLEQGPFKTTFFDNEGVNANHSVRKNLDNILSDKTKITPHRALDQSRVKYTRSPIYRGIDIILMELFQKNKCYPPDLKFNDLNSFKKHKQNSINTKNIDYTNSFLLVLQVPIDVNMIYHSPIFKTHFELVKQVYLNLPQGINLIVREHPLYINKYSKTLYDFIKNNSIQIDNDTALNSALEKAKAIIVNNSTVGIEAIYRYKTVVVLGNAFYDSKKIILKLDNLNEIKKILEKAVHHKPNKEIVDRFINYMNSNVLLPGSIVDRNLLSAKIIAQKIMNDA